MTNFNLAQFERKKLLEFVFDKLNAFYENTRSYRVTPSLDRTEILNLVRKNDFEEPVEPRLAVSDVIDGLQ